MTIKDKQKIAELLCDHFVRPIKERGISHEDVAANAMRFIQDLLRYEKEIAEIIVHFSIDENLNAGGEFLDELNIKH